MQRRLHEPEGRNISAPMSRRKQSPKQNRHDSGPKRGREADLPSSDRKTDRPAPRKGRQKGGSHGHPTDENWLYGFHAVLAALENPVRTPKRLLLTKNASAELHRQGRSALPLTPEPASGEEIANLLPPGAVHQGIALHVSPLPDYDLPDACEGARCAVILDQVTDPHNFGAILRSAAVFGATALVTTARHSPPLGGVLAKAASGALEKVKIARVPNLARAMEEMQELGFELVGLDGDAETSLPSLDLGERVGLVLGAEGAGLRRLTREHCDLLARLPASGDMRSLNVSNAAAVSLYELFRRTL